MDKKENLYVKGVPGFVATFCELDPNNPEDPELYEATMTSLFMHWLWYAQTHVFTRKDWPHALPTSPLALSTSLKKLYGLHTVRRALSITRGERQRGEKHSPKTVMIGIRLKRRHIPYAGQGDLWHPYPWSKHWIPLGKGTTEPDERFAEVAAGREIMRKSTAYYNLYYKQECPDPKSAQSRHMRAVIDKEKTKLAQLIAWMMRYQHEFPDRYVELADKAYAELLQLDLLPERAAATPKIEHQKIPINPVNMAIRQDQPTDWVMNDVFESGEI